MTFYCKDQNKKTFLFIKIKKSCFKLHDLIHYRSQFATQYVRIFPTFSFLLASASLFFGAIGSVSWSPWQTHLVWVNTFLSCTACHKISYDFGLENDFKWETLSHGENLATSHVRLSWNAYVCPKQTSSVLEVQPTEQTQQLNQI